MNQITRRAFGAAGFALLLGGGGPAHAWPCQQGVFAGPAVGMGEIRAGCADEGGKSRTPDVRQTRGFVRASDYGRTNGRKSNPRASAPAGVLQHGIKAGPSISSLGAWDAGIAV